MVRQAVSRASSRLLDRYPSSAHPEPSRRRWPAMLFAIGSLVFGATALADDALTVDLGDRQHVSELFSYPYCTVNCQGTWTLEQTVQHYLDLSVQRDGYGVDKVRVESNTDGHVLAHIKRARNMPGNYGDKIQSYLQIGQVGYQGWTSMPQHASDWNFFLTLGMPLYRHPTVQLLHFPPDTVLTRDHDYMKAATTKRWAGLLRENGASRAESKDFQSIVDIAPIAAPASAGQQLEGTYQYFNGYSKTLIQSWTHQPRHPERSAPMVAFGDPVRAWLCSTYQPSGCQSVPSGNGDAAAGASTSSLPILGLTSIQLSDGRSVAVLGANHPSRFFYYYQDHPDEALLIMQQDLVASCWQATLGKHQEQEPAAVLRRCQDKWPPNSPQVKKFYDAYVAKLKKQQQTSSTQQAQLN